MTQEWWQYANRSLTLFWRRTLTISCTEKKKHLILFIPHKEARQIFHPNSMVLLTGALVHQLRLISKSHDDAIKSWVITNDAVATESHLAKALHGFHQTCRKHLQTSLSTESSSKRYRRVIPLSVDVKRNIMDCYGRAFLLHGIVESWSTSGGTDSENSALIASESVTLIAAIMFYNIGLFYHMRLQDISQDSIQNLDSWAVRQYYEKANDLLGRYMEQTRETLWTMQAAIWHNLADSYRLRIANNRASWVYFEQLDAIRGWVVDKSDRVFFERALTIARMQQNACHSATAA